LRLKLEDLEKLGIKCPSKGKVVIVLNSKWCNSCKHLSLTLKRLKDEGLIELLEIDIDKYPSINDFLNLTAVPTLLFFKDGKLVEKNIQINEFPFVKNGIMIGINCEPILKEIIEQL